VCKNIKAYSIIKNNEGKSNKLVINESFTGKNMLPADFNYQYYMGRYIFVV